MTDPYRRLIEDRIAALWRYRSWYRVNRWADWTPMRRDHASELRALIRIAREARRIEAARPDPIDDWKRSAGPVDYIETL